MDVMTLIEKRGNLWEEARNFLNEHTNKDGKISDEDATTYDKMAEDIANLTKNIERFQNQAKLDAYMEQPMSKPLGNRLQNNPTETKTGRASEEYKQATLNAIRNNFKNVSNILMEGNDSKGGYLVPAEWDARLIDTLEEENVMRKLGTNITTSGEHQINIVASKPAALWTAEGGSLTFGDATFGQKTLDAHKLHVGVRVTNELLYDNAYNLENYLIEQFGKAMGNAEEDAFINGNGSGKPTGFLTTVSADTDTLITTAGTNIAADDIVNLVYSLKRPYRKNAVFLVNDATLAAIRKLKDNNQAYMWQTSYTAGEPDKLLGYPIYTSAYMPTISAGNMVLAFGDFSYYNIGDRGIRSFRTLGEKYADTDETAFSMIERVDGILTLNESIKVLKMKS